MEECRIREGERRMSTEKVSLRPITAADTDKIVTWRNRDFVWRNFIYQKPFTKEGHETWLREQVEPGYVAQFIICVEEESACLQKVDDRRDAAVDGGVEPMTDAVSRQREIGSVYLRDIDREKGEAEYGVFIGESDALGHGYGTQAAKRMLDFGFRELSLKKIFLRLLADNPRARKSYEKAGFQLIPNRRETVILEQGAQEVLFMEIDRGRWEERKNKA